MTLSPRSPTSVFLNISPGAVGRVQVTSTSNCGNQTQIMTFRTINCGTPNPPSNPNPTDPCNNPPGGGKIKLYNISPNPASKQITIAVEKRLPIEYPTNSNPYPKMQAIIDSKEGITFSEVNIYNSFGILVLSKQTNKAKEFVIPLNELKTGLYLVQIMEGEHTERHQIIIE